MTRSPAHGGRRREVFQAFLLLGLTSFGGPVAHLGYFRHEFVTRRHWLGQRDYADLVALCQFLPGPASSQVGFALGLLRAGPWGAALAWLAFTLPSALLLVAFALGASLFDGPVGAGLVHGLKVAAVAIVAQAVWGMAQGLCPDRRRAGIALAAVFSVVLVGGPLGQVMAILAGALAGLALCRRGGGDTPPAPLALPVSHRVGGLALVVFLLLLGGLPLLALATASSTLDLLDAFYRAGALVFGGGHVVLPLLEAEVVQSGWVSPASFLAGYGAAQAVPGPLFTFAAYLGSVMGVGPGGLPGAALALVTIFVPGLLLLVAVMPFWETLRHRASAQSAMRGANAAVVGILGVALYDPLWTGVILGPEQFALALAGFLLLVRWQLPAWAVVALLAVSGVFIAP
ncbi:chromate efflux transporter [Halomonas rhizosphaerae]|uniref:Chromate efflux transporter n=1 Tax=Halomonas rhizosphaerae TaxID=3043296 RepID=A0ABT6V4S9_9GAMM|nr:chromate efflux transporter [Halomonas rhizosphaerae]MDI5893229.1 chromate efflux transporter [Halomonas rhizosphaerae]